MSNTEQSQSIAPQYIPDFTKRPISYSAMKAFTLSPRHLVHYYQTPVKPTPAMELGSLVDILVFTPDLFEQKYIEYTPFAKRKNSDKKKWAEMVKEAQDAGKVLIATDELIEARAIKKAIFAKPNARDLLMTMTSSQERIYWTDKKTGIKCVAIPDTFNDEWCIDMKISGHAFPADWNRYFFGDSDLTLQVGFLMKGFSSRGKFPGFKNMVVDPNPPYDVSINTASESTMIFCAGRFEKYMQKLRFCIDNNLWHMGYEFHSVTGEFSMDVPGYLRNELESYQ